MSISIENITTQDAYVDANSFGQGTPIVQGWYIVANAVAGVQLTTGLHGQPARQEEVPCPPGIYPLQSNPKNPIQRIAFRSFVAGTPAQIIGALFYPADSFIQSGGSFDSQISSGGGVTPPGAVAFVTGSVSAAGAVLRGTGYTVAHPGAGLYTITFNAPFTQIPDTLVQLAGGAVGVATIAAGSGASVDIQTRNLAGVLADLEFFFYATEFV